MEPHQPTAPRGSIEPSWVRWRLILILMGFTGFNHFHRQSLPSVVNEIMRDCNFNATDMSWIFSAFLLGYVIFMIPGGWISDRLGGRIVLILSGFGTAGMVAATGYCGYHASTIVAFVCFLIVRFVMGVFTAPLFPSAGRIVAAWTPIDSRAWANGLVLGATTIGVSLAPVVFGKMSDELGWRAACGVMGALTALLTALWSWYGRNRPAEHPAVNDVERALIRQLDIAPVSRGSWRDFLDLLKNPNLVLLTLHYAAVGYYEYTLFYWMKYYFNDVRGYSDQTSRYYTAIVTFALVFAMPLGGLLSDRLVVAWGYRAGRPSVPIFGMLASAVLLFVATRTEHEVAVVALFFLAHAAIGLCEAPTWVLGLELGGKNCGTSAAIVNTGGNLGGLLAPVITAYVATAYGWNMGFHVASLACIAGVLPWLGIRLVPPRTTHDE